MLSVYSGKMNSFWDRQGRATKMAREWECMMQEKTEGIYPGKRKTEILCCCCLIPEGENHDRSSSQADYQKGSTPEQPSCRSSEGKQPNLRKILILIFFTGFKWFGRGGEGGVGVQKSKRSFLSSVLIFYSLPHCGTMSAVFLSSATLPSVYCTLPKCKILWLLVMWLAIVTAAAATGKR